jgi:poly(ribitol-phosphate) beta-N-acetylglucosaminyltransferase
MVRRAETNRPDAVGGAAATVSVIVPVWNMEPFLRQCLDSVVGQTIGLGRVEVIAVDDGSTDGSADLLETYAGRYPPVVVVREPRRSRRAAGARHSPRPVA